jgi:hypothetical protein
LPGAGAFTFFKSVTNKSITGKLHYYANSVGLRAELTLLFNFQIEYFVLFILVVAYLSNFSQSVLGVIMLSEVAWLLFFLQSHVVTKSLGLIDTLFIFFIALLIATVDLATVLSLAIFLSGLTGSGDFFNFSFIRNANRQFRSISEGTFTRTAAGFKT